MREQNIKIQCHSPLSELMKRFHPWRQHMATDAKRSQGFRRADVFVRVVCNPPVTRDIVDKWDTTKAGYEKPEQQGATGQSEFGNLPYTYADKESMLRSVTGEMYQTSDFIPYIFNHQQINNILQAADCTPPDSRSPERHLIMPEICRLLYCCGMRVSEVVRLKFSDVNLAAA
ncbi:MAG: hypothetical protein SRB2_02914 [Desulfobacteraceae bacterium Eth-SRB2]|nr:MAG: hypothetical protein SRB2_02914 [Desulfobacteraceae bacterium Eth-SRB2]